MKNNLLKIFLVAFFIPIVGYAYTSPGKPQGFVSDFANVIPPQEKQAIEQQLVNLKTQTGDEVAVVTVNSLGDETVETYAEKLFQEWGIGVKGKDNGLLILIAPNDHQVRIEVGYGLEGQVTDIQSGNIIRNVMTPAFREADYGKGISGAVEDISSILTNSPEAAQYSEVPKSENPFKGINFGTILIIFFIFINVAGAILGKTKSWWLGGVLGAAIGIIIGIFVASILVGSIAAIILTILGLIFDFIVSKKGPGSGHGPGAFWFGPRGGGGFGGGSGFGGFGGGMSGGGGASGRW